MEKSPKTATIYDRLSSLHDSILVHILSFLPTKQSIATSVLAKRYRNVWAADPALIFNPNSLEDTDLIDRVLTRRDPSSAVSRFCVAVPDSFPELTYDRSRSWITYVVARNVQELRINISYGTDLTILLNDLYNCQSLRILKVRGGLETAQTSIVPEPPTPIFINLRVLKLQFHRNPGNLIGQLVSSCLQLEELCLIGMFHGDLIVSAPKLKILELVLLLYRDYFVLEISCPRLSDFSLTFDGRIKSFKGDMPSLRNARIDRDYTFYDNDLTTVYWCQILRSVSNTDKLRLCYLDFKGCPKHLRDEYYKDLPTFHSLRTLKLRTCFHYDNVEFLVNMLENSPKLNFLTLLVEPLCGCNDKRRKWTSRKLPTKILHNLTNVTILNGRRQKIINKGEFLKFLNINVSEWKRVIKSI